MLFVLKWKNKTCPKGLKTNAGPIFSRFGKFSKFYVSANAELLVYVFCKVQRVVTGIKNCYFSMLYCGTDLTNFKVFVKYSLTSRPSQR